MEWRERTQQRARNAGQCLSQSRLEFEGLLTGKPGLPTMDFLRAQGQMLQLATYDQRLAAAAQALGFPLAEV